MKSPVGFTRFSFRVIADEGNNFKSGLWADPVAIVLPSLHRLICYAKHLSHLDIGQIPVNTCESEMFAQGPRLRRNGFLNPAIHRDPWKTCDSRPITNTQQGARRLRPLSSPYRRESTTLWALHTFHLRSYDFASGS